MLQDQTLKKTRTILFLENRASRNDYEMGASFLLTAEVFLVTVRLFYLRRGSRKQKKTKSNFWLGAPVSRKDQIQSLDGGTSK